MLKVIETAARLSGDVRNFFYNCGFDAKTTELVYLRSTLPSRQTLWESGRDHVGPLWSLLQSTRRLGHQRKRSRIKCCRGPLWCQRSSLVGLSSSSETRKHVIIEKGGPTRTISYLREFRYLRDVLISLKLLLSSLASQKTWRTSKKWGK